MPGTARPPRGHGSDAAGNGRLCRRLLRRRRASRSSGSAREAKPKGGVHVAFAAGTRNEVDAFYRAAIAAEGQRRAGAKAPLSRQLLRRVCLRSRRQQHRSRVSPAGVKRLNPPSAQGRGGDHLRLLGAADFGFAAAISGRGRFRSRRGALRPRSWPAPWPVCAAGPRACPRVRRSVRAPRRG